MAEAPSALHTQLSGQWRRISEQVWVEEKVKKTVAKLLRDLKENISTCDQFTDGNRGFTGEYSMVDYGPPMLEMPEQLKKLRKHFSKITDFCSDRPEVIEEAELLTVLTERLKESINNTYEYANMPGMPNTKHRKTMNINNDHPQYPVYPGGKLTKTELDDMRNIRDALENIYRADRLLDEIPTDDPTPLKTLLNKHPNAILFTGIDESVSREEIDTRLQSQYANAFNKGIGTLLRAFGSMEAAENAMSLEADAIEAHYKAPRKTTGLAI